MRCLRLASLVAGAVAGGGGSHAGHAKGGAGDISSVFNSLRAEVYAWPQRFADLKAELVPEGEPRRRLLESWSRLETRLGSELRRVKQQQEVMMIVWSLDVMIAGLSSMRDGGDSDFVPGVALARMWPRVLRSRPCI